MYGCETWCLTLWKKQNKDTFQQVADENIWAREGGIRHSLTYAMSSYVMGFIKAKMK
jgi:hypothetical protein